MITLLVKFYSLKWSACVRNFIKNAVSVRNERKLLEKCPQEER